MKATLNQQLDLEEFKAKVLEILNKSFVRIQKSLPEVEELRKETEKNSS